MNSTPCNSLINGIAADYLNINDRAIHYGDGLFETILCDSSKLYYWQQHYDRLQASAEKLKIACPEAPDFLNDISALLDSNKVDGSCVLKIILSRGTGERGYKFTGKGRPSRIVLLSETSKDHSSLLSNSLLDGKLFICEQQVSINENLAGLKHLNRLENVMARNEWHDNNGKYIDGLMLNADCQVIEGTMSNLFAVKDKQLFTPSLERSGVRGIMRDVITGLAARKKMQVSVTDLTIDALSSMDELFISNSLIGIKAVTSLGDSIYKDHSITERLFNELLKTKEDHAQAV